MSGTEPKQDSNELEVTRIAKTDVIIIKTTGAVDGESVKEKFKTAGFKNHVVVMPPGASIEILKSE